MWLKSFRIDNKAISDLELAVLTAIPDDTFLSATEIMVMLDELLPHWTPERGTIYPLLHRLTDQELLDRNESAGRAMKFQRTSKATTFLSSLLSSRQLLAQFDTTTRYLEIVARSMITIDPFAARQFLRSFEDRVSRLQQNITQFQLDADEEIEDEGWTEVDVQ